MNRKERKASGIKGKKGDQTVLNEAIKLARQLVEKGKAAEATQLYKQILEFDPDNVAALLDVGIDSYIHGKHDAAENLFNKTLRLDPKNVGGVIMLASIRMDQNRVEESLDLVRKAEGLNLSPKLFTRLGVIYRDAGQLDLARKYIAAALEHNPDDITALYTLQTLKKYSSDELARMEDLTKKKDITLQNKTRLEFALGKACLDNAQADQAFWHFAEANLLKRATYKYTVEMAEQYFAKVRELFNAEFVAKMRGLVKDKGTNQIFIVGMPRSGSTLVDQILSSHPSVTSVGEANFLTSSLPSYANTEIEGYSKAPAPTITKAFINECSKELLERIGDNYLKRVAPFTREQKIVVDKMLFNFAWLGVLRLALPDAKIIHCMRDPIDIGLSIWQLLFADDIPWAYDQKDIGRYYLAYAKLMDHWRKIFPGEFLDVQYEEVVADQEGQSRRILEFCGLSWNDDVLRFYENKRQVKTASVTQVRQPIYKDSVKKWKKYEKHLKGLITTIEAGGSPPG